MHFLSLTISCLFALNGGMLCLAGEPATNAPAQKASNPTGASIYAEHCASCHAGDGSGTADGYPEPLVGDFSVGELAELVELTMPEGEPDLVVGQQAREVAAFMHAKFYGPAAQLKARPPEKTLSRLTGNQLRNCVADLYGHFHPTPKHLDHHGLSATYTNGSGWEKGAHEVEQTDPQINFDFGKNDPADGVKAGDFRIRWHGALVPPRTGRYELVLRSSCACEFKFERSAKPLIDNHVQSEGKDEFRRTVYLIGGRSYLVDLAFYQKKRKTDQPAAKVSLSWVPPHGQEQVIPTRYFVPDYSGQFYTLQTKLPPDDRSYGYERGTAIDSAWDESVTRAAFETGAVMASEIYPVFRRYALKKDRSDDDRRVLRMFLDEWLRVAFRGPLDDSTKSLYIDRNLDAAEDDALAIKRAVLMAMKSPRFLYPSTLESGSRSQRAANSLAITLFDSLPSDDWLLSQIDKAGLKDDRGVERTARRMLDDDRCRAKIRSFLYHWIELDDVGDVAKSQDLYPGFDDALVNDLRASLDLFLDSIVYSPSSDFRQLVSSDWTMTSPKLQSFYGDAWEPESKQQMDETGFAKSKADPRKHVGVLTHPFLMSKLAYHETSSPIHRGVFLIRHLMGRVLRPPNSAFAPIDPKLRPDLTTRQRVELQTGEVSCQVCHQKINGLGFALENFDAVGRFRDVEKAQLIDASGKYISRDDQKVTFEGARELGNYVAQSEDSQRAFVEAAFEYFVKQPVGAFGPTTADDLFESFKKNQFNVRELILDVALVAARDHADDPIPSSAQELTSVKRNE